MDSYQLRPKLIVLPLGAAGIDATSLQSGRLPDGGGDQVLAGPKAPHKDSVTAGDRSLEVVACSNQSSHCCAATT